MEIVAEQVFSHAQNILLKFEEFQMNDPETGEYLRIDKAMKVKALRSHCVGLQMWREQFSNKGVTCLEYNFGQKLSQYSLIEKSN